MAEYVIGVELEFHVEAESVTEAVEKADALLLEGAGELINKSSTMLPAQS